LSIACWSSADHSATWFTGSNFEIPVPSKTSVIGFLVSWLAVGGMIGGFMWLMSF
jgi:hypothetical protein